MCSNTTNFTNLMLLIRSECTNMWSGNNFYSWGVWGGEQNCTHDVVWAIYSSYNVVCALCLSSNRWSDYLRALRRQNFWLKSHFWIKLLEVYFLAAMIFFCEILIEQSWKVLSQWVVSTWEMAAPTQDFQLSKSAPVQCSLYPPLGKAPFTISSVFL